VAVVVFIFVDGWVRAVRCPKLTDKRKALRKHSLQEKNSLGFIEAVH